LRYLDSAIALAGVDEAERVNALRERAADVLHSLGRFDEAAGRFAALLPVYTLTDSIGAARLHRKIAGALSAQQHVDRANEEVDRARRLLDAARSDGSDEWWREHFAVERVRLYALYIRAELEEMAEVFAQLAPQVDSHGTLLERGLFNRSLLLLRMREQRYRPAARTVELAASAVDQLREAGDAAEACFASFQHAFSMLWSGAIDDAALGLQQVLAETVRLGDAERNLLCLTYLAVAERLRSDVDSAQAFAEAAKAAARASGSSHYEGMANANLAWVAWRRGDSAAAGELTDAAAKGTPPKLKYPFVWLHALVGLAAAVEARDAAAALSYARSMIDTWQQPLPAPVESAVEAAVHDPTLANLAAVVDASKAVGYL